LVAARRLPDVERHDHHVDMRLMRERVRDAPARPIVQQQMPPAMEVPARHDERDLRVGALELRDVSPEAPLDVPIAAILHVQGDASQISA